MIKGIIIGIELLIILLIGVAYITLAERKIMGRMQRREGPTVIGKYGILQPIMDGIKLIMKESIIPKQTIKLYYIISPIISIFLSLLIFSILPIYNYYTLLPQNSILIILAILSINVYTTLYGGWSSNSKYSIIGSIRAISQLISYEISIGVIIMSIIWINKEQIINKIIYKQIYLPNILLLFPIFILLLISAIAETNRPPFDLPEAESELIAGYIVEYGGFKFGAIYLAEYLYIYFFSVLLSILFLGIPSFISIFSYLIIFIFIWIRASEPRIKYNDLISFGWLSLLPLSLLSFIFYFSLY